MNGLLVDHECTTMPKTFSWTLDRNELVGKLVRRHAFDFDAVSRTFRQHLKCEGVDFNSESTSPAALRKVFASSDRKRPTHRTVASLHSNISDGDNRLDGDWDHMTRTSAAQHLDKNTVARHCSTDTAGGNHNNRQKNEAACRIPKAPGYLDEATETATAPSSSTNESAWNFDRFLEEQRRKEVQHDDQKEKIFQKVLSALGSNAEASGAFELPPDILQAWGARKEKIAEEADDAEKRRQKLEEDHALAHQRQSLKQRYLPGSNDSVGEDPLASLTDTYSQEDEEGEGSGGLCHRQLLCEEKEKEQGERDDSFTRHQAVAEPVRLELGMDAEVLDEILDEIEESAIAVETNSELSRVLDELDSAAGDKPTTATTNTLLRPGVQE
ncbi:unnamed protein product [Pylaiella littoralis]